MPVFLDTPVDVAPNPPAGGGVDIDVSAYVSANATGVMLEIINTSWSIAWTFGTRKNKSTDDRKRYIGTDSQHYRCCGVDGSRVFELHVQANSVKYVQVWLIGYFEDDAVFFDNGIDKTPAGAGAYADIDISANTGADTAIAAIFEVSSASNYTWGLRCNGSTDDRSGYGGNRFSRNKGFIIGVDGAEICEGYVSNTGQNFYLIGYILSDAVFNINAPDISLGSTAGWIAITQLGAKGVIVEVVSGDMQAFGLRKNGSLATRTGDPATHCMGITECDASGIFEGIIENTAVDFFIVGYFTSAVVYTETFDDYLYIVDSRSKQANIAKNDYLFFTDAFSEQGQHTYFEALWDYVYLSDSRQKRAYMSRNDYMYLSDIKSISANKIKNDIIHIGDSLSKALSAVHNDVISFVDSMKNQVAFTLSTLFNISDSFTSAVIRRWTLNDVISISDSHTDEADIILNDVVAVTDSFGDKSIDVVLDDEVTFEDIISSLANMGMSDNITFTDDHKEIKIKTTDMVTIHLAVRLP
jgi:hypothetical protein